MNNTITITYDQIFIIIMFLAVFIEIIVLWYSRKECNKLSRFYDNLLDEKGKFYNELLDNSNKRYISMVKINGDLIKTFTSTGD